MSVKHCVVPAVTVSKALCGVGGSYMSKRLESKFDVLAEPLLPSIIILLQNSAKVMATSAATTVQFIIQVSL
jgi:hypothetical protein